MRISVIVPAYNAADILADCLDALLAQTRAPEEIIVVDDGSSDKTAEIACSKGVVVLTQPNQGPAAARNRGAEQASGDVLLFTDADCAPAPDWVERLIAPFADADVIGAKGAYLSCQMGVVPRFVQQEYESKYRRLLRQSSIDFIDTYSAAYRRAIFLENGGFDPSFPVPSVEDQDLSFRLARKGYRMVFVPQARVVHRHDANLGEYVRRKSGIGYWKALLLRFLPEKTFADSHTLPSQRWQILFLGLALAGVFASAFWVHAFWLSVVTIALFLISGGDFLAQIAKHDRSILWAAPGLLFCRAAALGWGLLVGFLNPPTASLRVSGGLHAYELIAKRGMDILGALVGLVVFAPLIAVCALAVKLDSPGAAFFVQERVGKNGRLFKIIKLRSMRMGAERQVEQVLAENPLAGPAFKLPADPRLTRLGRFLRRWSLDELPNLWNVLRGDMSLVGPRPEESWVVARYTDHQRLRLLVKPGMTGPMQVSGRGDLDFDVRLELELDYIRNYSLWRDLEILARTPGAVICGRGAY